MSSIAAGTDEEYAGCLSVGTYLGYRLLSVGCDTVFCVPGDFNCKPLPLDHFRVSTTVAHRLHAADRPHQSTSADCRKHWTHLG